MKLKGINPFEQHVEKIIIGGCGAAFVGAMAWQFFFAEKTVKVGGADKPVARAFEPAEEEAKKKLTKMDLPSPDAPELPKIDLGGTLALGRNLKLPDAAGTTIPMGRGPGLASLGTSDGGVTASGMFAIPTVPAPAEAFALAFRNTVSPAERLRSPELAKLLPAEQPFDKAAVSVEAEIDGKQLFAALSADPDGDGPLSAVLPNWISEGGTAGTPLVEVVGVQLERRTVRKPDGTTPSAEEVVIVPVIPGRTDPVQYWKDQAQSGGSVPPLLEEVREALEDIMRPPYLETIAGVEWAPPKEMAVELQPEGANKKDLDIARIKREAKKLDRRIAELGGGKRPQRQVGAPPPPGGGRPGGGSGPGRGVAPTRGGGDDRGQPGTDTQTEQTRQKALERLNKQRDALLKQLRDLGDKSEEAAGTPGEPVDVKPLFESDKVKVWAHDLTVEPGAVYQYRVRYVINNPLFDRALQSEQVDLARQQVIEGAWTGWTAPVDVGRDRYFFITNAETRDGVSGRPRATADLFVFYYGFYRNGSASVEPGDVMNAKANLPKLLLADMSVLEATLANAQAPVGPLDPIKREAPAPTPGQGRNQPRDQPPVEDPIMKVAAPEEIPLPVDAILMDVVTALGQTGGGNAKFDVTFRDQTGALVTVSPDKDRSRPEYKLVEASAKAGRDQGKLPPPEKEEEDFIPQPKRDRPPPPPPGGGGGGGG
ncbi:MAG TPA: hypothetical protein VHN77_07585 [Phycisphaerales bacterium]|nr:hypothetical protein [Phycisphaerales bacterium]